MEDNMKDNMKDMFKNIENLDINSKDFEEIKPPSYMYEPALKKECFILIQNLY